MNNTANSNGLIKYKNNSVEIMAQKIANESPALSDLTAEQLEQIAKIVITQNLTSELNNKAKIANINYKQEKSIFIMSSSRSGSEYTQISYLKALKELERYTKKNGLNILQLSPAQADNFIYSLTGSPNGKNLIIAGVSSFYSYLERRYSVIKNPIRGTKARPAKKAVKEIEIPSEIELFTILNELPELEKTAVYIMAYRGLRIGALKELKIWGNKYQSVSKGKNIFGEFPIEILTNIKNTDLNNKTPFTALTTNALKLRIYRATLKLQKEGKIQAAYSAHDFRHYFAVSEYQKDRDIYKLSKLLDHTNISITEGYLKGLKITV
jgi:site-specific recombinase XerD